MLCGKELPWVNRAVHLGIALTEEGDLLQDCKEKRAQFIDNSAQIRETFEFAHAMEKVMATEKYCTNIHGSVLWDLTSSEAQMVFRAWKTGIKISWNIPRSTHSYFVQEVLTTGVQSLEQRILRNTVGFYQSLIDCPSPEVAVLARISARDIRSSLGKNLQRIRELLNSTGPVVCDKGRTPCSTGTRPQYRNTEGWHMETKMSGQPASWKKSSLLPCRRRSLSFNLAHWITGDKLGSCRGTHEDLVLVCNLPTPPFSYIHGPVP